MSHSVSVKVSSRYQVVVPRIACERLDIQSGDRLLVDVQDGVLESPRVSRSGDEQ